MKKNKIVFNEKLKMKLLLLFMVIYVAFNTFIALYFNAILGLISIALLISLCLIAKKETVEQKQLKDIQKAIDTIEMEQENEN